MSSNLVGRLAHKLGLKHGHIGLYLPLREDTKVVGNVMLSHSIDEIHRFLELDVSKWHTGFETKEEIYEWVSQSPYYNPDIFLLDNRNAKARYRDAKRPTYSGMLEWIAQKNIDSSTCFQFDQDKSVYLPKIFKFWPSSKAKYDVLIVKAAYHKLVKQTWDDKLPMTEVMQISQLQGAELGQLIRSLKDTVGDNVLLYNREKLLEILQRCIDGLHTN